jgi:hypothetical protein
VPIPNRDNDEIRAIGYVALYSGYLEEAIGDCFVRLKRFDTRRTDKMWQVSARIESCVRAIGTLPRTEDLEAMLADLEEAASVLRDRNTVIHSPLYGQIQGPNVRGAAKPEDREKFINADQIYDLAAELSDFSEAFAAYQVRLPRFVDEARAP